MKNYLLSHGFGFSNNYWNNLSNFLDGNISYYDEDNLDMSKEYIGIGHSLGFLKLNNSGISFSKLFCIQGFLNFCGNERRLREITEPKLEMMITQFEINHIKTIKNFYKACGYKGDIPKNLTKEKLLSDLKIMRKSYSHCGVNTIVIGNKNDTIVPKSIINDNFSNIDFVSIKFLDLKINHTLGYHNAEIIFNEISDKEQL